MLCNSNSLLLCSGVRSGVVNHSTELKTFFFFMNLLILLFIYFLLLNMSCGFINNMQIL